MDTPCSPKRNTPDVCADILVNGQSYEGCIQWTHATQMTMTAVGKHAG